MSLRVFIVVGEFIYNVFFFFLISIRFLPDDQSTNVVVGGVDSHPIGSSTTPTATMAECTVSRAVLEDLYRDVSFNRSNQLPTTWF